MVSGNAAQFAPAFLEKVLNHFSIAVPLRMALLEEFSELSLFLTWSKRQPCPAASGGHTKSTARTIEPEHHIQPRGSITEAK